LGPRLNRHTSPFVDLKTFRCPRAIDKTCNCGWK
jgi:hypothetical protein